MNHTSSSGAWPFNRLVFIVVALLVLLLFTFTSVILTFIMPESYASTARIKVDSARTYSNDIRSAGAQTRPQTPGMYDPYFIQTECELIRSEQVLDKVVDRLDLNQKWGKKFNAGGPLNTSECRMLLKRVIELRPVRNTSLMEIRAYSDDKAEAADIANALAAAFRDYCAGQSGELFRNNLKAIQDDFKRQGKEFKESDPAIQQLLTHPAGTMVTIIDHAEPGLRPVRPNWPLNIFLGVVMGGCFGVVIGAGASWLTRPRRQVPPLVT